MTSPSLITERLSEPDTAALRARLYESIDSSGGPEACHPWTGLTQHGYGLIYTGGPKGVRRTVKVHRLLWEFETGESPETLDHTCHDNATCPGGDDCPHRRCANRAHLTPETRGRNAARAHLGRQQEECRRGHLMTEENTYVSPSGARRCRKCGTENARQGRHQGSREPVPNRDESGHYRPRGMDLQALVAWGLDGNEDTEGCWYWRNGRTDAEGYVRVRYQGKMTTAHALVYEATHGPVPEGHVVDHTCHDPATCPGGRVCPHRACARPGHLAAVTYSVNVSRARAAGKARVACGRGHEFTPENTYVDPAGLRHCVACDRQRQRDRRAANRLALAVPSVSG